MRKQKKKPPQKEVMSRVKGSCRKGKKKRTSESTASGIWGKEKTRTFLLEERETIGIARLVQGGKEVRRV